MLSLYSILQVYSSIVDHLNILPKMSNLFQDLHKTLDLSQVDFFGDEVAKVNDKVATVSDRHHKK